MLNTLLPPNYALISWRFPGPGVGVAGDRVLALAVPCPMPRAVAVVAARREGAVRMDMVAREAVGAFVDELRRDWPRVVRAFWRTTTPAPPALDESEALRVHGRAHPGRGGSAGGLGGLQPPLSWWINGNMGRVREKKRWRKEEKWRERERKKRLATGGSH